MKRGDEIYLKPGRSTYKGPGYILAFLSDGYIIERPDTSRWIWFKSDVQT